jgi:DNA-binding CsgD family transcriptional regulator
VLAAWSGDFGAAASLIAESEAVREATGARIVPHATLVLAGLRGSQAEVVPLIDATINAAQAKGQVEIFARWMTAILCNGLGRYEEAREAAREAAGDPSGFQISLWALPELIEAAAHSGEMLLAGDALQRLTETTQAGGTDLALGLEARSRALVADHGAADGWYREAIERLGRTQLRPDLARAHLLYGEWLRRQGHRSQAREQLRAAHDLLSDIGMEAFAERARRELLATGETARKRTGRVTAGASQELTAQEAQVAQLARDGLSNPEIGARLFISSHTVQYHLSKVFTKLAITSRGQLHRVLPGGQDTRQLASLALGYCPGGVDQADMAERLRKVADHLAAARVDFLGQQAHVVDCRHGTLEGGGGLVEFPGHCLRVRQPERAEKEGPLLARQAVMSQVPVHQPALIGQPGGDRVDGRLRPRVIAGQETGNRQH